MYRPTGKNRKVAVLARAINFLWQNRFRKEISKTPQIILRPRRTSGLPLRAHAGWFRRFTGLDKFPRQIGGIDFSRWHRKMLAASDPRQHPHQIRTL